MLHIHKVFFYYALPKNAALLCFPIGLMLNFRTVSMKMAPILELPYVACTFSESTNANLHLKQFH